MQISSPRLIGAILLCSYPTFAIEAMTMTCSYAEQPGQSSVLQNLLTEEKSISYDAVLDLLQQIEDDELTCSSQDLDRIAEFLSYVASQGTSSKDSLFDKAVLESDIQNMQDSSLVFETSYFLGSQEFVLTPFIYNGKEIPMQCSHRFFPKWKKIKHFIKNHKTAIIVGTVIVVAAVAITIAVASTTAANGAAAVAGAAAGAAADSEPSPEKKQTTLKEEIADIKTIADQSEAIQNPQEDDARALGAALAHEALNNFENLDPSIGIGHGMIDNAFSTDLSICYLQPSSDNWQSNALLFQGELDLKRQDFESAIEHFNKAIEADPHNFDAYRQRAYANIGLEEYDRSLNDFRTFIAVAPPHTSSLRNVVDFGVGFAHGLPKGVVESGHQLAVFASEIATHPINTSCEVCHAFSTMANLAYTQQWNELSQSLAPEVCQLINEWNILSPKEQGEKAGYVFGKYGGDILIPGASAKILSKGLEGAKEIVVAAKNLQAAEQVFALEAVEQAGKFETPLNQIIAKEATKPWTKPEIHEIKQTVFPSRYEVELRERGVWDDFQNCRRAEKILEPFQGKYLPENEIRELIHEAGISTFPRPAGIPENYRIKISNNGSGMKYVHPNDEGTYVRVMPGKPHSEFSAQQKPYVIQMDHGKALDKNGKIINKESPEAHIPLSEYVYRG